MKLFNLFKKKQKYKPTDNYLVDFYNTHNEEPRLLSRHGQIEFLTTVKYIEKYLNEGMKIIEIGAATGRYSLYFAEKGYSVDAVDLVEHNLNILKSKIKSEYNIRVSQGNAIDLSGFDDNSFDITLLLGPMYHLYTVEDQKKAISEAVRITRPNGLIFIAYCMYDASVLSAFRPGGYIKKAVEDELIDPVTFNAKFPPEEIFKLYRKEEIEELMNDFNVKHMHFVATDGFACYMADELKQMDDYNYKLFLNYHFATCERQDLIGMSHHTLDIFRKE